MIAWHASQCRKGPERAHRRKPSSSREGWAGTDPLSQGCILFHQSYYIVRLIENENLFHLQNHFSHGQNLKNHFDLNVSVGHPAVPFLRTRSDKATLLGHSARSFLTVPGASPSPRWLQHGRGSGAETLVCVEAFLFLSRFQQGEAPRWRKAALLCRQSCGVDLVTVRLPGLSCRRAG